MSPKPKKRWWRIILGAVIVLAKIAQFVTVGPMELAQGATKSYVTGAIVGDIIMFTLAIWLLWSGMKAPAQP